MAADLSLLRVLLISWPQLKTLMFLTYLRKYDTIKLVDEIPLNFPKLFNIGKHVKFRVTKRRHYAIFVSSRGQKIKNRHKIQ